MEKIRRSIKLFFAIYGNFLFKILCGIGIIFICLKGINYIYVQNNIESNQQTETEVKTNNDEENIVNENKKIIKKFLTFCNQQDVDNAYIMLAEQMKEEQYTKEIFYNEIIGKVFSYKKEYKIEKINENYFKVNVFEGILETGSTENRLSDEMLLKILNEESGKKIYIER